MKNWGICLCTNPDKCAVCEALVLCERGHMVRECMPGRWDEDYEDEDF